MLDGGTQDPLRPLEEQHGQITEWAAQVRASAAFVPGQLSPERVARLARFYRDKVLPHFRYEERHLFPALLRICGTPSLTQRLLAITQEHDELRLRIEILLGDLDSLATPGRSEALERATVRRAQLTIDRLLEHAAAEDALVLPLLVRHRVELREVMGEASERPA
jgi:hemerythrin-like domain-containing protein